MYGMAPPFGSALRIWRTGCRPARPAHRQNGPGLLAADGLRLEDLAHGGGGVSCPVDDEIRSTTLAQDRRVDDCPVPLVEHARLPRHLDVQPDQLHPVHLAGSHDGLERGTQVVLAGIAGFTAVCGESGEDILPDYVRPLTTHGCEVVSVGVEDCEIAAEQRSRAGKGLEYCLVVDVRHHHRPLVLL